MSCVNALAAAYPPLSNILWFWCCFQAWHHQWNCTIHTCLVALYTACLDTYAVGFSCMMAPRNLLHLHACHYGI